MAKQPSSPYVKPVQGEVRRLDQGVDYQGTPGESIVAIGLARISAIKQDPGGFGIAIYYTLMDGPARGRQVYVGHAQPVARLRVGQLVQAGAPVATLLSSGLGNAHGLAGWTEIGFAKGGVPDPGTAKQFKALVDGAADAPMSAPPAPAAPTDTGSSAQPQPQPQPQPLPVSQPQPDMGVTPSPDSTVPVQPPPGSGISSTNAFVTDLWNRIASQPGSSPDAQLLAANAQLAAGGQ